MFFVYKKNKRSTSLTLQKSYFDELSDIVFLYDCQFNIFFSFSFLIILTPTLDVIFYYVQKLLYFGCSKINCFHLKDYLFGLNMFLVLINIPTFHFSPSKIFLQLLVPIEFSITTFDLCFKVNSSNFFMKLCRCV